MNYRNADMVDYYNNSADFRILTNSDPLLRACFDGGQSPMQTIIHLADRMQKMRRDIETLYECVPAPIFIVKG